MSYRSLCLCSSFVGVVLDGMWNWWNWVWVSVDDDGMDEWVEWVLVLRSIGYDINPNSNSISTLTRSRTRLVGSRCRPSPLNLLSLTARATCSVDWPPSSPSRLVNFRETAFSYPDRFASTRSVRACGNPGASQNPLA